MKVIRADTKTESKELFDEIIDHLATRRNLKEIVKNGMTIGVLYHLVNDLIPQEIPRSRPFVSRSVTLPTVWSETRNHLENPSTGIGAAIIGLQGKHDHWTVATRIEGESLFLSDSDALKRLSQKRLTTGTPRSNKIHRILPSEVIFLG